MTQSYVENNKHLSHVCTTALVCRTGRYDHQHGQYFFSLEKLKKKKKINTSYITHPYLISKFNPYSNQLILYQQFLPQFLLFISSVFHLLKPFWSIIVYINHTDLFQQSIGKHFWLRYSSLQLQFLTMTLAFPSTEIDDQCDIANSILLTYLSTNELKMIKRGTEFKHML